MKLLLVSEVADYLRVSTMTIYRLIRAGKIEAIRVGGNYRIRVDEFEDYLKRNEVQSD